MTLKVGKSSSCLLSNMYSESGQTSWQGTLYWDQIRAKWSEQEPQANPKNGACDGNSRSRCMPWCTQRQLVQPREVWLYGLSAQKAYHLASHNQRGETVAHPWLFKHQLFGCSFLPPSPWISSFPWLLWHHLCLWAFVLLFCVYFSVSAFPFSLKYVAQISDHKLRDVHYFNFQNNHLYILFQALTLPHSGNWNVSALRVISDPSSALFSPFPWESLGGGSRFWHPVTTHHPPHTVAHPKASVIPISSLSSAMYVTTVSSWTHTPPAPSFSSGSLSITSYSGSHRDHPATLSTDVGARKLTGALPFAWWHATQLLLLQYSGLARRHHLPPGLPPFRNAHEEWFFLM